MLWRVIAQASSRSTIKGSGFFSEKFFFSFYSFLIIFSFRAKQTKKDRWSVLWRMVACLLWCSVCVLFWCCTAALIAIWRVIVLVMTSCRPKLKQLCWFDFYSQTHWKFWFKTFIFFEIAILLKCWFPTNQCLIIGFCLYCLVSSKVLLTIFRYSLSLNLSCVFILFIFLLFWPNNSDKCMFVYFIWLYLYHCYVLFRICDDRK